LKVKRIPGPGAKQLEKVLSELKSNKVGKVGWFKSAKYEDGTQVAYVAAIQEFGDPGNNIPARPFMRPTLRSKQNGWRENINQLAKLVIKGESSLENLFETVGLKAAGDIREKITTIQSPKLADATIAARLRKRADKKTVGNLTKPLVDTEVLLNTLTNIVEDK
jgi:hypothetical protein